MASKEVLAAALATSTTYESRDGVGKAQYQMRIEKLLDAVEPLIAAEAAVPPLISDIKIREIAFQAAGAASRVLLPDDQVMPNQQLVEAVNGILTGHGVETGPDSAADFIAGRPVRSQWTVNGKPTEHDGDRFFPLAPSGSYDSIGWPEVGDVLVVVRHYGASDFSSED